MSAWKNQSAWRYVNLPAQVRAHPRASAGAGTLAALGAGLWFLISRRIAARRRLANRFMRRANGQRLLAALAITIVSGLARRLMARRREAAAYPDESAAPIS